MTHYNVQARSELKSFIAKLRTQNLFSSAEIRDVCSQSKSLFEKYQKNPEVSLQGKFDFINRLHQAVTDYQTALWKTKSWWQRIIGFLGIIPFDEFTLHLALIPLKESLKVIQSNYKEVHSPYLLLRILDFFGIDITNYFTRTGYNNYCEFEQIKHVSHHLMGKTILNHYADLQGKPYSMAYQHFADDLNDFLSKANLDFATKEQFNQLLAKIEKGFPFSRELDYITALVAYDSECKTVQREQFVLDYAFSLRKAIMELEISESILLPHGFRGDQSQTGGHATVIECTKVNDDGFVLRIFNTGSGEHQIASYKGLLISELTQNKKRPIKITSPLTTDDLINSDFIVNLVTPLIVPNSTASNMNKMNELFLQLYQNKKLHDDTNYLDLQTNGTCSHSSLLAWFKTQVSPHAYALFNDFVMSKAMFHLNILNQAHINNPLMKIDKAPAYNLKTQMYADLKAAGQLTLTDARTQLAESRNSLQLESQRLKKDLDNLLKKKSKNVSQITDYTTHYAKKLNSNKLSDADKKIIATSDAFSPIPRNLVAQTGFFALLPFDLNPYKNLSDRAQKAIIAKKLAAHEAFLSNNAI